MSGKGRKIADLAMRQAFEAHGYSGTDEEADVMFEDLLFTFSSAIIDAVLLVANGRKTIQPEDFAALSKLHALLSDPITMRARSAKTNRVMRGGTSLPQTYFDPEYGSGSYVPESSATGGHGASTTFSYDMNGETQDLARSGLGYSAIGGAGKSRIRSGSRSRSKSKVSSSSIFKWSIPADNISKILREYRSRFNNDVRVTDAAKLYLRATIKLNIDAVLDAARTSSKSTRLTIASLRKAADRHVLLLVLP